MSVSNGSVGSTNQTTKVRVFKPKAIVLEFHGTIAPKDWEDICILPYIRQHLKEYLTENWNNPSLTQLIPNLRQESFDQHFVYENYECPVISDDENDINEQILSANNFLIWQIDNRKETHQSLRLCKQVWTEGFTKRRIKVPLFNDVVPALNNFKKFQIKISLFSSTNPAICQKMLENTSEGDISHYLDQFLSLEAHTSKDIETFKKISKELDIEPKDILYITDYGQSAKSAKQLGFQCLLIIRPQNRKIRDYYLLRFNTISSLLDIEFVERQ